MDFPCHSISIEPNEGSTYSPFFTSYKENLSWRKMKTQPRKTKFNHSPWLAGWLA